MLQLYYYPGNASLTPHILLEEIGAPYELKLVDRPNGGHRTPEYLKLNPNGYIPVMAEGDLVLYETPAICLYLVDRFPAAQLAPVVGSDERAHFYKWISWLNNTLQATLKMYWFPQRWADDEAGTARIRSMAEDKIGAMLDQLDTHLQTTGSGWMLESGYSALDPYALMLCRWTGKFTRPARDHVVLADHMRRVVARPAVERTFTQEALPQPWA